MDNVRSNLVIIISDPNKDWGENQLIKDESPFVFSDCQTRWHESVKGKPFCFALLNQQNWRAECLKGIGQTGDGIIVWIHNSGGPQIDEVRNFVGGNLVFSERFSHTNRQAEPGRSIEGLIKSVAELADTVPAEEIARERVDKCHRLFHTLVKESVKRISKGNLATMKILCIGFLAAHDPDRIGDDWKALWVVASDESRNAFKVGTGKPEYWSLVETATMLHEMKTCGSERLQLRTAQVFFSTIREGRVNLAQVKKMYEVVNDVLK